MVFLSTIGNPSNLMTVIRHAFSAGNLDRRTFCFVIKAGTFTRCVIWPLIPPLMLYQYIRQKDVDMYAFELLKHRSRSEDGAAFYDPTMPPGAQHWRNQSDLKIIRDAATNH